MFPDEKALDNDSYALKASISLKLLGLARTAVLLEFLFAVTMDMIILVVTALFLLALSAWPFTWLGFRGKSLPPGTSLCNSLETVLTVFRTAHNAFPWESSCDTYNRSTFEV